MQILRIRISCMQILRSSYFLHANFTNLLFFWRKFILLAGHPASQAHPLSALRCIPPVCNRVLFVILLFVKQFLKPSRSTISPHSTQFLFIVLCTNENTTTNHLLQKLHLSCKQRGFHAEKINFHRMLGKTLGLRKFGSKLLQSTHNVNRATSKPRYV